MRWRAILVAAFAAVAVAPASAGDDLAVAVGKALFDRDWVVAPASTRATDGLGPLHNARSCAACHRGGGGAPLSLDPEGAPTAAGLVLRFQDDPAYGRQLQTGAVHGQAAEGQVRVSHDDAPAVLGDGTIVVLRRPRHTVVRRAHGTPPRRVSPRLAPSLRGVGLLAAVPDAAVAALADPDDRDGDGDGIRGRPGAGRFGLRADQAGLREQVAEALLLDLGLSSSLRPEPAGDSTPAAQADCRALPHGDRYGAPGVEIGDGIVASLVAYLAALPPPRQGPHQETGERLFTSLGCAGCHTPSLPVGLDGRIAPYTDLLLHDLGPELADEGAAEGDPTASLWRTAPLWGLGAAVDSGKAALLHDGRARDAQEAILWHGGEAQAARDRFRRLGANDRADLLAFLASL
jgi:CxxC motif-containing protein (DUF1111 family)